MTDDDRRPLHAPVGAAGPRDAGTTDDGHDGLELPAGVARRLAAIDRLLPETPPWHAARADGTVAERRDASRAPMPADGSPAPLRNPRVIVRMPQPIGSVAGAVVVVAAALLAIALLAPGRLGTGPSGPGTGGPAAAPPSTAPASLAAPSTATASQVPPSASGAASGAPASPGDAPAASGPSRPRTTPSAKPGELVVIRGAGDGLAVLTDRLGWACTSIDSGATPPNPSLVDKIAITGKVRAGWLELPDGARAWLGTSVVDAATAYGAQMLAIGSSGDAWILLRGKPAALALRADETPLGRTFWTIPATAQVGPCPTRPSAP